MTDLLAETTRKLKKALDLLEYSFNKIQKLPDDPEKLDAESLETWESFSSRFSRVVDLFLVRFLRTKVLQSDPGFQGSLRDFVDQAEKLGLISDANRWMQIRGLRNLNAHEYNEENLKQFFLDLKTTTPEVLRVKSLLK